jgi:hypothetical protein
MAPQLAQIFGMEGGSMVGTTLKGCVTRGSGSNGASVGIALGTSTGAMGAMLGTCWDKTVDGTTTGASGGMMEGRLMGTSICTGTGGAAEGMATGEFDGLVTMGWKEMRDPSMGDDGWVKPTSSLEQDMIHSPK